MISNHPGHSNTSWSTPAQPLNLVEITNGACLMVYGSWRDKETWSPLKPPVTGLDLYTIQLIIIFIIFHVLDNLLFFGIIVCVCLPAFFCAHNFKYSETCQSKLTNNFLLSLQHCVVDYSPVIIAVSVWSVVWFCRHYYGFPKEHQITYFKYNYCLKHL